MSNTKERFKNHLHYGKWVYLGILVVGFFAGDLLYTMTEYRPPDERKVDVQLVSPGYVDTEQMVSLKAGALLAGQGFDETLEEVSLFSIAYSGDPTKDIYGAQKFTVMVAAGEGDLYIVPRVLLERLWFERALVPLDDYVARGLLKTEGMDLSVGTLGEPGEVGEEGTYEVNRSGETKLYGLPVSNLPGLAAAGYQTEDAYAVLMASSKNPETSAFVLQYLIDEFSNPQATEAQTP